MSDVDTVVAPDDIDVRFVPQLSQGLVAMDVGAEPVLLGVYGQALVLNPTAGLVWRFLDGETALADLIDDFSEVLDVDCDTVRADIVDFVRTWIAPGCSRASPSQWTPANSPRSTGRLRYRSPSARCSSPWPSST